MIEKLILLGFELVGGTWRRVPFLPSSRPLSPPQVEVRLEQCNLWCAIGDAM